MTETKTAANWPQDRDQASRPNIPGKDEEQNANLSISHITSRPSLSG